MRWKRHFGAEQPAAGVAVPDTRPPDDLPERNDERSENNEARQAYRAQQRL
jgi:hypothetical protein